MEDLDKETKEEDTLKVTECLITTQKVLFYTFKALCVKHFCVVVLHL